jgi:hypothetical protein
MNAIFYTTALLLMLAAFLAFVLPGYWLLFVPLVWVTHYTAWRKVRA